MKYFRIIIITSVLLLILAACGKTNGKDESGKTVVDKKAGQETNEISVVFSDQEQYQPGAFELQKTLGFISGMRYDAKSTAKHAYVAFANYNVKLGLFSVELPQEPGQIVIVVSFKTEHKEVPFEQQMTEYTKMQVPTGAYQPGWMAEGRCFQVHYFVSGESGGPSISGQGASGTATLTLSTPEKVSGSLDFTSLKGSTMKGTFNVKIEKDLWTN